MRPHHEHLRGLTLGRSPSKPLVVALAGTLALPTTARAQTLRPDVLSDTLKPRVSIFADGNIRASATGSQESTVGTGSLGILVQFRNIQWSGSVNIASSVDTLRDRAGAAILSPGVGKGLESGVIELRARGFWVFKKPNGLHVYVSAAKSIWTLDDTTSAEAVVVGVGASGYRNLVSGTVGDNRVALTVEAGLSARALLGDVVSRVALREAFLGSRTRRFYGVEGGMQIRFNNIVAGIQLYYLRDLERRVRIDGLTGGQLVAGLSVQGNVFTGELVPDDAP